MRRNSSADQLRFDGSRECCAGGGWRVRIGCGRSCRWLRGNRSLRSARGGSARAPVPPGVASPTPGARASPAWPGCADRGRPGPAAAQGRGPVPAFRRSAPGRSVSLMIQGVQPKGLERKLIERRDEDDRDRQGALAAPDLRHLQPAQAWHLDVQEDHVRGQLPDGLEGRRSVSHFAHDLHVRVIRGSIPHIPSPGARRRSRSNHGRSSPKRHPNRRGEATAWRGFDAQRGLPAVDGSEALPGVANPQAETEREESHPVRRPRR